jgi:hypothetical protein
MLLVLAQATNGPSFPVFDPSPSPLDRVAPWIQVVLLALFLILVTGVVIWVLVQLARDSKAPADHLEAAAKAVHDRSHEAASRGAWARGRSGQRMGASWGRAPRSVGLLAVIALVSYLGLPLPGRSMEKGLEAAGRAMGDMGWPVDGLRLRGCSYSMGLLPPPELEATYAHVDTEESWVIELRHSLFGGWNVTGAAAPEER